MSLSWNDYFINIATLVSTKSKDRSTKVGAVIVGPQNEIRSTGYNGFPAGADDTQEKWHQRPTKYLVTLHAEENAIVFAARMGVSINNCKLYVTHHPCSKCMRLIAQSGIKEIYTTLNDSLIKRLEWKEEQEIAIQLAKQAGIKIRKLEVGKNDDKLDKDQK